LYVELSQLIFHPDKFDDGVSDSDAVIPKVTIASVLCIVDSSSPSEDDDEEEREERLEEGEEDSDGTLWPVSSVYRLAMAL
jgi:hypothetical protein